MFPISVTLSFSSLAHPLCFRSLSFALSLLSPHCSLSFFSPFFPLSFLSRVLSFPLSLCTSPSSSSSVCLSVCLSDFLCLSPVLSMHQGSNEIWTLDVWGGLMMLLVSPSRGLMYEPSQTNPITEGSRGLLWFLWLFLVLLLFL